MNSIKHKRKGVKQADAYEAVGFKKDARDFTAAANLLKDTAGGAFAEMGKRAAGAMVDIIGAGEGAFDTHQGVKGREFKRVLVVMDDEEAGGFLFSYEKLFEVKSPTKNDIDKLAKGEETGVDRTRRLFYVTCTRAEDSLALVAYSNNPELLKQNVINKGWFNEGEIVVR